MLWLFYLFILCPWLFLSVGKSNSSSNRPNPCNMKQLSKLLYTVVMLMTNQDRSKSSISEVRHKPTHDSESLNQAVDRTINDQNFLNTIIKLLGDLNFPAFKNNIIDHIKKETKDPGVSIRKFRWIHTIQRSIPCTKSTRSK